MSHVTLAEAEVLHVPRVVDAAEIAGAAVASRAAAEPKTTT
jgi:hypothetical protein